LSSKPNITHPIKKVKEMEMFIALVLSSNIVYMHEITTMYPINMYNYYISIKRKTNSVIDKNRGYFNLMISLCSKSKWKVNLFGYLSLVLNEFLSPFWR
jgi:hypothetical protein